MATKDKDGNIDVKVARNITISKEREKELENKAGGSNIGEYSNLTASEFAGSYCGLPGAYPINTIERARSALRLAHNASNPDCIREQVYKRYPELKDENMR